MVKHERLDDFRKRLLHAFRLWRRSCAGLAGYPCTHPVGLFVDLRERPLPEISVDQGRGEGVARAHGIGHLH